MTVNIDLTVPGNMARGFVLLQTSVSKLFMLTSSETSDAALMMALVVMNIL